MTRDRLSETLTGLDPWAHAELPDPPQPRGLQWLTFVGPGVIVLGLSIGGGEFLLGPAAFVRYGLSLLWITLVSVFFQTIFNTELMRYTVATGEPAFTGFMRTRPGRSFWAWFYAGMYFLQTGWPYSAGLSAGAIFFLVTGRIPPQPGRATIYKSASAPFFCASRSCSLGRRIERTLELLNWVMVVCILGGFLALSLFFVPAVTWAAAIGGLVGFDLANASVQLPAGRRRLSAAGGARRLFRRRRHGQHRALELGARQGLRDGAACWIHSRGGGRTQGEARACRLHLRARRRQHAPMDRLVADRPRRSVGRVFHRCASRHGSAGSALRDAAAGRDQHPGTGNQRGARFRCRRARRSLARRHRGRTRGAGSSSRRSSTSSKAWCARSRTFSGPEAFGSGRSGGDVRVVYYSALARRLSLGYRCAAARAADHSVLLAANVAAVVFTIASIHLLYVNTRLLPPALRPPLWRRVVLVAMAVFYGFFTALSIRTLL